MLNISATPAKEEVGINFFVGTWQQALKKSALENKLIFLSLSTSWCGWCQKLKQTTFIDARVGEYFNATFINVELDGEQEEGQRLAKKFGVTNYPSLFIVDKTETQLLSSEGYHDAGDLLKLVKTSLPHK